MNIRFYVCMTVCMLVGSSFCWADGQYVDLNISYRDSTPMPAKMNAGCFYIPIRINGSQQSYLFLIDTGANVSVIDSELATKLNVAGIDKFSVGGVGGGDTKAAMTDSMTLETGDATFSNARMAVISNPFHDSGIEHPVSGILGFDMLKHTVLKLDYANKAVTIFDPLRFTDTQQIQIPLGYYPHPQIEVTFAKDGISYTTPVAVDSGASGGLALPRDFIAQNSTFKLENTHTLKFIGLGGEDSEQAGTVPELHLGDQVLKDQAVELMDQYGGSYGLLGAEVLSQYDVTFDTTDNLLLLRPNGHAPMILSDSASRSVAAISTAPSTFPDASAPPQPTTAEGAGFQVNQANGSYIVTAVSVRHSGIHVGDLIMQIDGTRTAGLDMAHMTKLLQNPIRWICIDRGGSDMQVRMSAAPAQDATAPQ